MPDADKNNKPIVKAKNFFIHSSFFSLPYLIDVVRRFAGCENHFQEAVENLNNRQKTFVPEHYPPADRRIQGGTDPIQKKPALERSPITLIGLRFFESY
jgi:hypothetical protein